MAGGANRYHQPGTKARKLEWYPKASEDTPKIVYKDREISYYGGSGSKDVVKAEQAQVREWTSRVKNENKQNGSYERWTAKEKVSIGEPCVEKGKVGTRDEWKTSSTLKVGNKRGYTEIYTEKSFRKVDFGGGKKTSSGFFIEDADY